MTYLDSGRRPAAAARELRRLTPTVVVPTSYVSRVDDEDALALDREAVARQGYDDGYAQGMAAARVEQQRDRALESQRAATALAALSNAIRELEESGRRLRAEVQAAAPRFAFAIVEELLGRELKLATSPGYDAIQRALTLDEGSDPVTVWMHPQDIETLGEMTELQRDRELKVVPDPSIERGGAVAEIGKATLDGQLGSALERVRQVLQAAEEVWVSDDRVA